MTHDISTPLPRRTLAETMADALTEAIVAGRWPEGDALPPGAALPTEPELAARFGVSRAVVRDATRMLVARGLVDAQHGRGVFVTQPSVAPFGEALLLALRRAGATVWDVERFEQMILPEVHAEAARQATDEDVAAIRRRAAGYHAVFAAITRQSWERGALTPAEREAVMAAFLTLYEAIFAATHNAVWALLAEPLSRLRAPRSWEAGDMTAEDFIAHERRLIDERVEAVAGRDPDRARAAVREMVHLPAAAEAAMRATPVGRVAQIPLPLKESDRERLIAGYRAYGGDDDALADEWRAADDEAWRGEVPEYDVEEAGDDPAHP
jgi:DNA-binding FadR family transcriptional regulator